MSHWLLMILCCGLPLILIFTLPYIGRMTPGAGGVLAPIIPFICPLMMGFMIFAMHKGSKDTKREHCEVMNDRAGINEKI